MATLNIDNVSVLLRRDTASNWATGNPILFAGEMGIETDTNKGKVGNGVTAWSNLPYTWVHTITTGTTDGTIKVDGTDVAVCGLGLAAYVDNIADYIEY